MLHWENNKAILHRKKITHQYYTHKINAAITHTHKITTHQCCMKDNFIFVNSLWVATTNSKI